MGKGGGGRNQDGKGEGMSVKETSGGRRGEKGAGRGGGERETERLRERWGRGRAG